MHTFGWTVLAIAVPLSGGLAAQDHAPRPLRFAWPVPARAKVVETIPGEGPPTIELTYTIDVDRESPGSPRRVKFSGFAFRRLGSDSLSGVERADFVAMTVPGLVARPNLVIDDSGRATATEGFEASVRSMLAMLPDVAPAMTPDLRTKIENQWLAVDARDLAVGRVQADWESWVGAWIGFVPKRGESEPKSIELKHGGVDVPAEVTLQVVPDVTVDENHVRLLSRTVANGESAQTAMQRIVNAAEQKRAKHDGDAPRERKVLRYEIEDAVEAVVDRRTLQPTFVHVRRSREVAIEGETPAKRLEDRRFDFEWVDAGR